MDATERASLDQKARQRVEKERQARRLAWWNGLSPKAQRAEIKAGHVRVTLPYPAQMKAERRRARGKR